jgi:hypothetical protein
MGSRRGSEMQRCVLSGRAGIPLVIFGVVFLLTAGAALAAGTGSSQGMGLGVQQERSRGAIWYSTSAVSPTVPVTGGVFIPTCIADYFNVPVSDVIALRAEGVGFGELVIAHFLAQDGGLSVEDIVALRESGMGWGEIAQYLGLPAGRRGRNLGGIISGRITTTDTLSAAADRLSVKLGASAEEIADLLDQGASYGTIIVAYKMAAQQPDLSPDDLVAQRLEGASWGQIKRDLRTQTEGEVAASAGGAPPGQEKKASQGHGNPHDKDNQGRALGHDKDRGHGGGRKD